MTDPELPGGLSTSSEVAAADRAQGAVVAARGRARRAWRVQLLVLLVIAALLGAGIWLVWWHSEIRAVHMQTTTQSPSPLPTGSVPATLSESWHTADRAAVGERVSQDVVVTFSERTVSGRDATTGAVRWSYTRSDRRICTVAVQDDAAVAIYEHDGLCDEVTGLDTGSGERMWVRTLLSRSTPSTVQVSTRPDYLLIVTPDATELLQPSGGLDWWYDAQKDGCTTRSAVLGSAGVLLASRCTGGDTLSLRALGNSKNRAWNVALAGRTPLSSDTLLTALRADGRSLDVINAGSGRNTSTIALNTSVSAPSEPAAITVAGSQSVELVATKGAILALRSGGTPGVLWLRASAVPPTNSGNGLLLAGASGVELVSATSGRSLDTYRITGLPAGAVVDRLGLGLLVSAPSGTTAYR